jgi:tetratricopeptide (TPR) repeat protein
MKQVFPRSMVFVGGCLSAAIVACLVAASAGYAQVEGRESPQFGQPTTPPPAPVPADPSAPPAAPAPNPVPEPMGGEQPAPGPAPDATFEQPQGATRTPSEEQISLGNDLMQQGKHDLAIQHYEEAVKLAGEEKVERANALYHLANALRSLNRLDDAIIVYSASIEANPNDGEVYLRRGIAWFYKGEYSIAWNDFDDSSVLYHGVPERFPLLWKGLAKARQGKMLDAIDGYTSAVLADPRFSLAYTNRGLAYLHIDEPAKALDDFDQAIRNDPGNPAHYFRRGIAQTQLGHNSEALQSFNEAIRLDPNYAEAVKYRDRMQGKAAR